MRKTKDSSGTWTVETTVHSAAFLSGFVTMALEMLVGRVFTPYFGGTIYTWGALIAVFLMGMMLGYAVGGRLADKFPDIRAMAALFCFSALPILFVPAYGDAAINGLLDCIEDLRFAAVAAALALAFLPAALLAAVGPFCVRLLLDNKAQSGAVSGRLSALGTAGSIIGTLVTSFFLIPTFGVKSIFLVLAGVSVLWGFVSLFIVGNKATREQLPAAVGLFIALAAVVFWPMAGSVAPGRPTEAGLLEKVDSIYNTIFIEQRGSRIFMNFGYRANRYIESAIDLQDPDSLVVKYTRDMAGAVAFASRPIRKIALVGLGGGRTINYLLKHIPDAVADVAELDPEVTVLAKKYFNVRESERLHVYDKDGRVYLKQSKDLYDLIILDAYRGSFVPFHLTTREFYELVKERLNNGGVVAQNVAPDVLFFNATYATMKSVFDQVDVIQSSGNIVLVGYAGPRLSEADLTARAAEAQERHGMKYDLREIVKRRRPFVENGKAEILVDDFAPVEKMRAIELYNRKKE